MSNKELAVKIIELVGGNDNIKSVSHCMTRLRFELHDVEKANQEALKALDQIMGVVNKGGQYQLIIGPSVTTIYDELVKLLPEKQETITKTSDNKKDVKKDWKYYLNAIMGALAGCMTPLIPILLCCGIAKALVAVLGPQLFGVFSETSNFIVLMTFVGDAGFYFMPIIVGFTAAKKFDCNPIMGAFMGAILVHPTLIDLATKGQNISVYGIPAVVQNYSSTIIPIILTVWVMSYVERFFKKYTSDVLKVIGIPLGTMFVMLPLELCLFGPLGSFLGQYICNGIINLYNIAGPLAVGLVAAFFGLLVMCGMHIVLFAFLFMTFPLLGYDAFIMPATFAASWASAGVTIACILKFKDKKKKTLTASYLATWVLGGVGEPLLYGLKIPYRTPLYATIVSGFISGVLTGILGLKAYVLGGANGMYSVLQFAGGPNANYIIMVIVLIASVAIGFVTMWFMKLDESLV